MTEFSVFFKWVGLIFSQNLHFHTIHIFAVDSVLYHMVHSTYKRDIQVLRPGEAAGLKLIAERGILMFQLDLKSRKSIYEQVMDNLKELIMTGTLSAGEKLPSVRELSKQITVNPNTVQKAYRELERQGYIYTTTGVGTFVADHTQIKADPRELEAAKAAVEEAFRQLLYLGLTHDEAKEITMTIIEERRPDYD